MTTPHPPALRLPRELTIYTAAETRAGWLTWLASLSEGGEGCGDGAHAHAETAAVWPVDGEDVDEIDAAGVQLLIALAHRLRRQHATLQLRHASRPLRQACQDLGLAGWLLVTTDEGATA